MDRILLHHKYKRHGTILFYAERSQDVNLTVHRESLSSRQHIRVPIIYISRMVCITHYYLLFIFIVILYTLWYYIRNCQARFFIDIFIGCISFTKRRSLYRENCSFSIFTKLPRMMCNNFFLFCITGISASNSTKWTSTWGVCLWKRNMCRDVHGQTLYWAFVRISYILTITSACCGPQCKSVHERVQMDHSFAFMRRTQSNNGNDAFARFDRNSVWLNSAVLFVTLSLSIHMSFVYW